MPRFRMCSEVYGSVFVWCACVCVCVCVCVHYSCSMIKFLGMFSLVDLQINNASLSSYG